MKELLTEWRKFVNEGAESDEFEDAVRKSVKHYYFVRQFRPHRKSDLLPPVKNPWDSIFFALEFIEGELRSGDLKDMGKLGSYFEVPEVYDIREFNETLDDLIYEIKNEIDKGLKDLIVGKRVRIEARQDSAKKYQGVEGAIVDIPRYFGGKGRREFKVEWDNESLNNMFNNNIRNPYRFQDIYIEVIDPPSMEEVREVIGHIHPAPFEYWRKK